MVRGFKFICFGDSVINLKEALEFNVIGLTQRHHFAEGEPLYYAIKSKNEWKVCGRAKAGKETDINPFENPGRFYTYTVTDFEACIPFDIKQKSQQCLGPYWALIFQRPKVIESQEYNQFIVDSFRTTDKKSMLSEL